MEGAVNATLRKLGVAPGRGVGPEDPLALERREEGLAHRVLVPVGLERPAVRVVDRVR